MEVNHTNICQGIDVQGSKLTTGQTGNLFFVSCGNDMKVCHFANITCAQGMDCKIECHANNTDINVPTALSPCHRAIIIGPTDYQLRVECEDDNACQSSKIHAENSSFLEVTCTEDKACCDIAIFCPSNTNQHNTCQISGISKKYAYNS